MKPFTKLFSFILLPFIPMVAPNLANARAVFVGDMPDPTAPAIRRYYLEAAPGKQSARTAAPAASRSTRQEFNRRKKQMPQATPRQITRRTGLQHLEARMNKQTETTP